LDWVGPPLRSYAGAPALPLGLELGLQTEELGYKGVKDWCKVRRDMPIPYSNKRSCLLNTHVVL